MIHLHRYNGTQQKFHGKSHKPRTDKTIQPVLYPLPQCHEIGNNRKVPRGRTIGTRRSVNDGPDTQSHQIPTGYSSGKRNQNGNRQIGGNQNIPDKAIGRETPWRIGRRSSGLARMLDTSLICQTMREIVKQLEGGDQLTMAVVLVRSAARR